MRFANRNLLLIAVLVLAFIPIAQAQTPAPTTVPANLIRTSPARPTATESTLDLPRVLGSLAIVIAAIFALRWIARRFFRFPAAAHASELIEILARTPVSPRQNVLILKIARRVLVVADNGQQLTTLCEITDPRNCANSKAVQHKLLRNPGPSSFKAC
jgi:flagellar biosynthetic protein FliO